MSQKKLEDLFLKYAKEAIEAKTTSLAMGQLSDFASYKSMCGQIEGLNEAISLFEYAKREANKP